MRGRRGHAEGGSNLAAISWVNSGVSTCGLETPVAQARMSPVLGRDPGAQPRSPLFGPREVATPPKGSG